MNTAGWRNNRSIANSVQGNRLIDIGARLAVVDLNQWMQR
jgi:hypothetical protein